MLNWLLFLIFGLKRRDSDHGEAIAEHCPRCDNDVYFHAWGYRTWFHIFWIPLIPWTKKRFLVCPICEWGLSVNKQEYKLLKELAGLLQSYREGTASAEAYQEVADDVRKEFGWSDEDLAELQERREQVADADVS